GNRNELETEILSKICLELIFPFNNFHYHTFFLPANRNFYPNFYKYIYSVSKEEKDTIGHELGNGANLERIKTLAKRPYTQPMDELNTRIFNLNNNRTPTGHYEDLLTELEEIIGGEIEVISVEGIAPIEFRLKIAEGKSLDMHVASSSSNQLTTLYLYLKYWAAERRNFLILDEPEENLHPKNQLKLLELLIKFSKRNDNRILITTHSTLLSDSINNHLHLGHLKQEGFDLEAVAKEKDLHIDANAILEPDETGVYFFNGSRIFEYDVNDYGVVFGDFETEERKVRNDGDALRGMIYNHLKEQRRKNHEKVKAEREQKLQQTKDA
ncbi:MAG: AAA family ATPase, partial [Chitinophagales bacterium]